MYDGWPASPAPPPPALAEEEDEGEGTCTTYGYIGGKAVYGWDMPETPC